MLAYGAIGSLKVIINSLINVPSVMDVILGVIVLRVNCPSHFREDFSKTLTFSSGDMRYLVSSGS